MSITFHPELPTPDYFAQTCPCGETEVFTAETWAEAEALYQPEATAPCCGEWDRGGFLSACWNEELPEANFSNSNAYSILERLGLDMEPCGAVDADDILGRALVANIGRSDDGVATTTETTPGGATWTECGVPAGYFDRSMAAIVAVAEAAKAQGVRVVWS
jgi:hypothetical protein